MATHRGECFCGAVRIEVSGDLEGMGYCHCRSCRSWSGGPVNAFTLWKPDRVRVVEGSEYVGMFQKTPGQKETFCHILTKQTEASIFAVNSPSGTQLIDFQIEQAVEGTVS